MPHNNLKMKRINIITVTNELWGKKIDTQIQDLLC